MKKSLFLLFLLCVTTLSAQKAKQDTFPITILNQEICNNGIDDDGDGLIDLNDSDCDCVTTEIPSLFSNHSFESYTQCPTGGRQLNNCVDWYDANTGSMEYMNTCGYVFQAVNASSLVPFPDGNGIVGGYFMKGWHEYPGGCLTESLQAGTPYQLTLDIASLPVLGGGFTCSTCVIDYEPVELTVYGTSDCANLPTVTVENVPGLSPNLANPGWSVIGKATYYPVSKWGKFTINFTPSTAISAVAIGAPEQLPPTYFTAQGQPYFMYDDIVLNTATLFGVSIAETGSFCANDLVLTANLATPLTSSATYQWYKDGVAISGATSTTYAITSNFANLGSYTVRVNDGTVCITSVPHTVSSALPSPEVAVMMPVCSSGTGTITVLTPASEYSFNNGVTWGTNPFSGDLAPGFYRVKIKTASGCISTALVINIIYTLLVPDTIVVQPSCNVNGTITITTPDAEYSFDNGVTWTTNPVATDLPVGNYFIKTRDASGCIKYGTSIYLDNTPPNYPNHTKIDPNCTTGGTITITTPSTEYSFDNAVTWVTNPVATNLPAGDYVIKIKSATGCVSIGYIVTLAAPPVLPAPTFTSTEPNCSTNTSGTITITSSAASYSFDGGVSWSSNPIMTGLSAGDYNLAIKDTEGCVSSLSFIHLNDFHTPSPTFTETQPDCTAAGSITITTPAQAYSFDGGATWTTNPVLNDLYLGYYDLKTKNSNGCISYSSYVFISPSTSLPGAPTVIVNQPVSCQSPFGTITVTTIATEYSFDNGVTWGSSNTSGLLPVGDYMVKIKDASGCKSLPVTATISFSASIPPAPAVTATNIDCTNPTGSITIATVAAFYSFDNGTTWISLNVSNNLSAGTYHIKIKNAAGCESLATTVTISSTAVMPLTPTVTVIQPDCIVATGTITVTSSADAYSFDNGLNWQNMPVSSALGAGTYQVKVKNIEGCISPATSVTIVPFTIGAPNTSSVAYCEGETAVPLIATGSNLLWYDNAVGGTGTTTAPTPITTVSGTVAYYLSQSIGGCESQRAAIMVTIFPKPLKPVADATVVYCQHFPSSPLSAIGTNLLWYVNAVGGTPSSSAPIPSTSVDGTKLYYVSQIVNGCESERTVIEVAVNPAPSAPIVETPVTYLQNEPTVPLTAQGFNLVWYDENNVHLPSNPTPSSISAGTFTYYVTQIVDGCESLPSEIRVEILPDSKEINYPKFFTPNGDSYNDTWHLKGLKDCTIYIFDRYGKLIKKLHESETGWDGTYNGAMLPATDYWFRADYFDGGDKMELTGHFALKR